MKKVISIVVVISVAVLVLAFMSGKLNPVEPTVSIDDAVKATLTALANEPTETPTITITPVIGEPLIITPTPTLEFHGEVVSPPDVLCNKFEFFTDITVPDDTYINAGLSFEKVWRIKNTGECTWQPYFEVVRVSGAQLGYETTLLGVEVKPGEFFDVAVDLKAPTQTGFYKAWFMIQDPYGDDRAEYAGFFELGATNRPFYISFYVPSAEEITQVAPKRTQTIDDANIITSGLVVGSYTDREMLKAFSEFSLHNIPSNANVTNVFFTFSNNTYLGDAFKYGCLQVTSGNYFDEHGALNNADYFDTWSDNSSEPYLEYCNPLNMATHGFSSPELTQFVRSVIRSGATSIQFKLSFGEFTSGDALINVIEINQIILWVISDY